VAPARIDDFGAEDSCETSKHILRARALHVVLREPSAPCLPMNEMP